MSWNASICLVMYNENFRILEKDLYTIRDYSQLHRNKSGNLVLQNWGEDEINVRLADGYIYFDNFTIVGEGSGTTLSAVEENAELFKGKLKVGIVWECGEVIEIMTIYAGEVKTLPYTPKDYLERLDYLEE